MKVDSRGRIARTRCLLRNLAAAAWMLLLPSAAALAVPTVITEFFNSTLRHYVLITSSAEVAAIEAGAAGPGWQKTGRTLFAHTEANDAEGLVPVCRFYGSISPGPNSHFFTADPDECAAVKTDPGWHYEGIAFYVTLAADGECAADRVAVWRAYNNGFKPQQGINDGNHRFATDHAITHRLADFGWNDEGIVFCALATTPFVPYVFALSSAPVVTVPGATRSVFFTLAARNGFTGEVTLSTTGLPPGISGEFEPPAVTLGARSATVALRLTAAGNTPVTTEYTNVTINGTAAGGNAFTGIVVGVRAADDSAAIQAMAVAAVEERSHALRVQGLKGPPYIQGIAEFMSTHPAYSSVGSDATMLSAWGMFADGTLHVISDNLERPAVTPQSLKAHAAAAVPAKAGGEIPGETKARLVQVFGPGLDGEAQQVISDMRRFLRSKGWSVRSGADADGYVTTLKQVRGDGFFYLNAHGDHFNISTPDDPDGMYIVWTASLVDPDYDHDFALDRLALRLVKYTAPNFLEADGEPPLADTRYAITYRFVDFYMKFEDSSVAFMNACHGGVDHPVVAKFRKAFHDRGAGVYLGWNKVVRSDAAFAAAPWFVDRMVGANLHSDKESPPQRAFPYDLVLQDMARNHLDTGPKGEKLVAYPKTGLKYPPIFAPSIRFVRVNEYDDKLELTGEFGEKVPKVTVGGTQLGIDSNTVEKIVARLPRTGAGSHGDVVVEVRGVKSNARQLSEWQVPFTYDWAHVFNVAEFHMGGDTTLRYRADLGRYRLMPHETPHWIGSLGGPPTQDTTLRVGASGTHVEPGCASTLGGVGDYPTPASPNATSGLVLANFFKFDSETKNGSIGLAFGEFGSQHTVTLSGSSCGSSSTVPVPIVLGLLEGQSSFPNAQADSPGHPITLVPLPALNFTLGANWGIPAKQVIDTEAGGEIKVFWPAVPAIAPPRETIDSGK